MARETPDHTTNPVPAPDPGEASTHGPSGVGGSAAVGFVAPVRIAGFRLGRLLGSGGMGLVYEAEQESLRRPVAIKLMKPGLVVPELLARFESEGRLLARLDHENIASVIDAGVHRDERGLIIPYLVMELISSGVTLRQYASERSLTVAEKIEIVLGVCAGIGAAHAKGIIHRDLKPSNILIVPAWAGSGQGPRVKLIDFGIAKMLEGAEAGLTSTGAVVGTPEYMSPEQILSARVDHRSDIHAIGAVLYELLCGRLPRRITERSNRAQLRREICECDATPLRQHDRSHAPDLETIAGTCLRSNPDERYQSVEELASDLRAFLRGEAITARAETGVQRGTRSLGRLISRQRGSAAAAVCAAATLVGITVLSPAVFHWTGAGMAFNRALAAVLPAASLASDLPDVRLVAIADSTDIEQAASIAGVTGVRADQRATWRPLYAETIRRLSGAGVRAIGVDILFRRPTDFDAPLEDALRGARVGGTPVVLAAPSWQLDADGRPEIAPRLANAAAWGPAIGGFVGPDTWSLDVAVSRAGAEPLASFALQLAALARAPDAELSFGIDRLIEVRFLRPGTQRRSSVRPPIYLRPSGNQSMDAPSEDVGLLAGDSVTQLIAPLDPRSLDAATLPIERVLAMSAGELRAAFAGQIVVIGNTAANGGDVHEAPGGGVMPGAWSHASGVQRLLRGDSIDSPVDSQRYALLGLCAAVGAAMGFFVSSHFRRAIGCVGLTLIPLLGSVLWLRSGGVLWNPIPAIGAGLLAALIGFALSRLARRAAPLVSPDLATTAQGTS
ncbi:MAG: protein kinase [Phycisphaerales bacterium]|nr:protein kinase [Phycisphaerales bacterium]